LFGQRGVFCQQSESVLPYMVARKDILMRVNGV